MKLTCQLACACFGFLSWSAVAGPRSSANYAVPNDTVDAGGRRAASASYSNDGSTGGVVGISTVVAPVEAARHGFIGQLYEVASLQLSASPPTINESSTRQLSAAQVLDDLTTIAVPAASISWSVRSGPLSAIGASGLATAATVFQPTPAVAQGVFAGQTGTLDLTVLDTLKDNFGLYAADGLDDAWQNQFFGPNSPLAAAGADPDSDGRSNLAEFNALTDPTSGGSFFTATSSVDGGNVVIRFPTVTGRTYAIERSDDLAAGTWTGSGLPAPLPGDGAIQTFTIPLPDLRRFLRVLVGP